MALELRGVIPAAVTPFHDDQSINYEDLQRLVRGFVEAGVVAVQCVAHAGEVVKLNRYERKTVVQTVAETVNGRLPVIAGIAAEYVGEAIQMVEDAKEAGADAVMILPPFHIYGSLSGVMGAGGAIDPTGEHSYRFHKEIADTVDIPIVLFNYGDASVIGYSRSAMSRLLALENVVAVKYIAGNIYQFQEAAMVLKKARPDVALLSADDLTLYYTLVHGADGALVGIANLVPEMWVRMVDCAKEGKYKDARAIHDQLVPIANATHDPIKYHVLRIKEAMYQLGTLSSPAVRPPLYRTEEDEEIVHQALMRSKLS